MMHACMNAHGHAGISALAIDSNALSVDAVYRMVNKLFTR